MQDCPVSAGHVAILLSVRVVSIVTSVLQTVHRALLDFTPAHFPYVYQEQACTAAHRTRRCERAPLYCVRGVPGKGGDFLDYGLRYCRRLSELGECPDWLRGSGRGWGGR